MASRNAEILKRLRAEAAANGLCYICRCRPVKPSRRSCVECLERGRLTKQRLVAEGRCACGAERGRGSRSCDRCMDRDNARQARYTQRRIDDGLCRRCPAPAKPGCKHCDDCIAKASKYTSNFRRRNRQAGLCPCGAEPTPGYKSCDHCRAYWKAYQCSREAA